MSSNNMIYQKEILHLFCINISFIRQYGSLLSEEYFDSSSFKILFQTISNHVLEYDSEMTKKQLKEEINILCEEKGFTKDFVKDLKEEINSIFMTNIDNERYIIEKLVEFIRYQAMKTAIIECVNILERGNKQKNYEQVLNRIDYAMGVGYEGNRGYNAEDIDKILPIIKEKYNPKNLIKTGFKKFDKMFMGGFAGGELHVIAAPPKSGKSTLGVNMGFNSLLNGHSVFHITLEISEEEVMYKYAIRATKSGYKDLMNMPQKEYLEKLKIFKKYKPNLFVKHYPEKTATTLDIRGWISKIKVEKKINLKNALIIIDYDDTILPTSAVKDNMYEESGNIYSDMIGLAKYFDAPILTFSQPNRAGWMKAKNDDLIGGEDLSHSARKAHRATSISSMMFKPGALEGKLYIDRSRRGIDGVVVPIERDLTKALIKETNEKVKIEKIDDASGELI